MEIEMDMEIENSKQRIGFLRPLEVINAEKERMRERLRQAAAKVREIEEWKKVKNSTVLEAQLPEEVIDNQYKKDRALPLEDTLQKLRSLSL